MNDLYDVILHLIEVLLPDNAEKHKLVEDVKYLQEKRLLREEPKIEAKVQEKKAKSDGIDKQ